MGRKLYVGNLPYETGEAELQELFARAGTVETVKVMRDMATGRARGFAFVEMASDEEAQKAITELNEFQLGGRGLTVNEARPKPAFAGGGGGFDGAIRVAAGPSHAGRQLQGCRGGRRARPCYPVRHERRAFLCQGHTGASGQAIAAQCAAGRAGDRPDCQDDGGPGTRFHPPA